MLQNQITPPALLSHAAILIMTIFARSHDIFCGMCGRTE
jgi:hypothetical protein